MRRFANKMLINEWICRNEWNKNTFSGIKKNEFKNESYLKIIEVFIEFKFLFIVWMIAQFLLLWIFNFLFLLHIVFFV